MDTLPFLAPKPAILIALYDGPAFGATIAKRISDRAGFLLSDGTLYPALSGLAAARLVKEKKGGEGRARVWELTSAGQKAVIAGVACLRELSASVPGPGVAIPAPAAPEPPAPPRFPSPRAKRTKPPVPTMGETPKPPPPTPEAPVLVSGGTLKPGAEKVIAATLRERRGGETTAPPSETISPLGETGAPSGETAADYEAPAEVDQAPSLEAVEEAPVETRVYELDPGVGEGGGYDLDQRPRRPPPRR